MSFLGNIIGKIFGTTPAHAETITPPPAGAPAAPAASTSAPAAPAAAPASVDVNAIMEGLAAKHAEKLNWKTSIVDLLKLLGLDSSLSARQELARELHYTGDMHDSAAMNIWLHKEVLQKIAANGGKLPADLNIHH
ncbi:MAG: DUF3597 domain-containing protein [Hyphomicrobiales bacterium]|nr:DUF3597 domain-containing protein [Hyphomicrobiales bacterium]